MIITQPGFLSNFESPSRSGKARNIAMVSPKLGSICGRNPNKQDNFSSVRFSLENRRNTEGTASVSVSESESESDSASDRAWPREFNSTIGSAGRSRSKSCLSPTVFRALECRSWSTPADVPPLIINYSRISKRSSSQSRGSCWSHAIGAATSTVYVLKGVYGLHGTRYIFSQPHIAASDRGLLRGNRVTVSLCFLIYKTFTTAYSSRTMKPPQRYDRVMAVSGVSFLGSTRRSIVLTSSTRI
jgi:hypothetical protein